jgi:hypothetical protein
MRIAVGQSDLKGSRVLDKLGDARAFQQEEEKHQVRPKRHAMSSHHRSVHTQQLVGTSGCE